MSENTIRLAKRMVELGLCSRRQADDFIEQGRVRVDGIVVNVLGSRVTLQQRIDLDRPAQTARETLATMLFNKPSGMTGNIESSIRQETHSALDTAGGQLLSRHLRQLTAFGAQPDDTTGLVILTQDRGIARKLLQCEQEYLVPMASAPDSETLKQRFSLLVTEQAIKVTRQSDRQLRIVLPAPSTLSIPQLCKAAGFDVQTARCIRIGRLALGKLKEGEWRFLLPYERF